MVLTKKELLTYLESYPEDTQIVFRGASGMPWDIDRQKLLLETNKEDKTKFTVVIK